MIEPTPTIQIDTREQAPLAIQGFPVEVIGLPCGDYGIRGFSDWDSPDFIIERKSLDDLCGSLGKGRARFIREVQKLRQFGFRALVIEADRDQIEMHGYRSLMNPDSILSTLDALAVRCGVHVYWSKNSEGAARQVENLVRMFVRGRMKDVEKLTGRPR